MKSEMRETKSIAIPNFSEDHEWKVGDKVVFVVGKTDKTKIELGKIDQKQDIVMFHTDENFVVEKTPYVYLCEILNLSQLGKIKVIKLVRRCQELPFGNTGITDFKDETFDIHAPNVFKWWMDFFYETYVVRSFNAPFTPLMGIACKWEWVKEYDESEIEYSVEKTMPEGYQP